MSAPLPNVLHSLDSDLRRIMLGTHHDPHAVLGAQRHGAQCVVVVHLPGASHVVLEERLAMTPLPDDGLFFWEGAASSVPQHYRIGWHDAAGIRHEQIDPYSFSQPLLADTDLYLFNEGRHQQLWRSLGAHPLRIDGVDGVRFSVWAPNAERISVVGPICAWDGRRFPMRARGQSGIWELFIPGLGGNDVYKFEIRARATGAIFLKSDPMARATEQRPATASVVEPIAGHRFNDAAWLSRRGAQDWLLAPMSIYEVHLGSWQRGPSGEFLTYRELAATLIPRVRELGFTHLELLPITEHPLDDSWGYQTTGYFAPTSRHGSADDLRFFIDQCHQSGIGVLLDWVPGHFPRDAHGLANFDGSALYEYADPRKAEHRDWGTLIFNYERHEVRSFLISSAVYWLEEFHFDGLRVDAVASMLYLDFSRQRDDFVPNRHGGNHNLEAIDFLRELNAVVHARCRGAVVIAEESTDWPLVSRPVHDGGLGFSMKWNMGWMHDTLAYFREDPLHRPHHQDKLTFGIMYAYSENFVLPLSHDEVVHLKKPLLYKMPGDRWQQFANLRLLYTYMWTFPGRKLLFMGGEFGQTSEWNSNVALPTHLREFDEHRGVERLVADLNQLYTTDARLHRRDFEPAGFRWIDCEDRAQSVLSYLRLDAQDGDCVVVVLNFTPVPRQGYRVGVPQAGTYTELLNSDRARYGGSNVGNPTRIEAELVPAHGQPCSLVLWLPPLAGLVLAREDRGLPVALS